MGKRITAVIIACLLAFAMGQAPAKANELSGGGIVLNWTDNDFTLPPDRCKPIYIGWKNVGMVKQSLRVVLTNRNGETANDNRDNTLPGKEGLVGVQICGYDYETWIGPLQLDLLVGQWPSQTNVGSTTVSLTVAPPQALVDVVKIPCSIEKRERFCKNERVIRVGGSNNLFYGESNWIALFNQRGPVDISTNADLDASMANDRSVVWTTYLRPAAGKFIKGQYAVMLGTGAEPAWRCTSNSQEAKCWWSEGFTTSTGYKFKWNGSTVKSIKKMSKAEVRKFNLR